MGGTALMAAAAGGNAAIAHILLDAGADINAKDKDDETALNFAVVEGCEDVVELLLNRGASVGSRNRLGDTPLLVAAVHGHSAIVSALLQKVNSNPADYLNAKNFGETALTLAAFHGHTSGRLRTAITPNPAGFSPMTRPFKPLLYKQSPSLGGLNIKGGKLTQ